MDDYGSRITRLENGYKELAKELRELGTVIKKTLSKPGPKAGAKKKGVKG